MPGTGPTANLPGRARRSGRSGTAWVNAEMIGECIGVEWNVNIAQISVVIAGTWQNQMKPGAEDRAGTFRVQDVHDRWTLMVWRFVRARRNGDRSAADFPEFDMVTKLDDIGAPDQTRWSLEGCQLFEYTGGHSQEDEILIREIPFSFRDDAPLHAFEYTDAGLIVTEASA